MQRIAQRDQHALSALYERYHALVYSMAYNILQQAEPAEEVAQDIFIQLWQKPDKWDHQKGQLSSWLLSVARYTAIDRLRKEQRRPTLSAKPLDRVAHLLDSQSTVDDPQRDNGRILRDLIQQLPQEQREVIFLAFFRGMTHSEIAAKQDIPLGTVKSRIRLGLEKLRDLWQAHTQMTMPPQGEHFNNLAD